MKSPFMLALFLTVYGSCQVFAQSDVIQTVFSDLSEDKRSQIELIDTLTVDLEYYDSYNYSFYQASFGLSDFEGFYVYRHKELNKVGLIVFGKENYFVSEAIADSIYLIRPTELDEVEYYDENGYYTPSYTLNQMHFVFVNKESESTLYTLSVDSGYTLEKVGSVHRNYFKAVSFEEIVDAEYGSYVHAVFANLGDNKIYSSSILNENLVQNEVYAYRYDSYYYGEYDYYYDYDSPEVDYTVPIFETRLNYEPIEIVYLMQADTISQLIRYSYGSEYELNRKRQVPPAHFSSVWKAGQNFSGEELVIIDGTEIKSDYSLLYASTDQYSETSFFGEGSLNVFLNKMNLSKQTQSDIDNSIWKGSKESVKFIELTSYTYSARFKDYYLFNDQVMVHIWLTYDPEKGVVENFDVLNPQEVFEKFGSAYYDDYNYMARIKDESGKEIDLVKLGVDYYYNTNFSVAKKNLDSNRNLVLTNESLGNLNFLTFTAGDQYVGRVKVQWIGSPELRGDVSLVGIKSMPFGILDEKGRVITDDVASLSVNTVSGFNLCTVTNSAGKTGVIGPDGSWIVKQEFDAISLMSTTANYTYSDNWGFPVFFAVYNGTSAGLLDSKGNWVVAMGQDYIEICKNEILVTKDGKVNVYSFDGKILLQNVDGFGESYYGYNSDCYSYDFARSGNRTVVINDKYGVVDEKFQTIIPFQYSHIAEVADQSVFVVANDSGKYGMINTTGIILPLEYDAIKPFDYKLDRLIATKNNKDGVVNLKGDILIPFEYYEISTYSEWDSNLVYISDPDYTTNIIDTSGNSIISGDCSYIYLYPELNILLCSSYGKCDFYTRQGVLMYSVVADYVDPYSSYNFIQIYELGDYDYATYGAFDLRDGTELMPAKFESLYPFWIEDQIFFAGYVKGKVGVYAFDGTELVAPKGSYLDNYFYDDGYYTGKSGYFVEISNKKGKSKIIQLNW